MTLPVLGAALTIEDLPAHADWLREAPRDLERNHSSMPRC